MKNNLNFLSLWFGIIMILVVLAGAIAFTFTDFMDDRLYGGKRVLLTIIFAGYAVYRGIRIYQVLKSRKDE